MSLLRAGVLHGAVASLDSISAAAVCEGRSVQQSVEVLVDGAEQRRKFRNYAVCEREEAPQQ